MEEIRKENIIDIGSLNKKPGSLGVSLILASALMVLILAFFGLGFLLGQIQSNTPQTVLKKAATISSQPDGSKVFYDPTYNYEIKLPPGWNVIEKKEEIPGVELISKQASIEFWLSVEQKPIFSTENEEEIENKTKTPIEIDGAKLELDEYLYKTGSYFSVLILKAKNGNPTVTFWLRGSDKTSYEEAKSVVSNFRFQRK